MSPAHAGASEHTCTCSVLAGTRRDALPSTAVASSKRCKHSARPGSTPPRTRARAHSTTCAAWLAFPVEALDRYAKLKGWVGSTPSPAVPACVGFRRLEESGLDPRFCFSCYTGKPERGGVGPSGAHSGAPGMDEEGWRGAGVQAAAGRGLPPAVPRHSFQVWEPVTDPSMPSVPSSWRPGRAGQLLLSPSALAPTTAPGSG